MSIVSVVAAARAASQYVNLAEMDRSPIFSFLWDLLITNPRKLNTESRQRCKNAFSIAVSLGWSRKQMHGSDVAKSCSVSCLNERNEELNGLPIASHWGECCSVVPHSVHIKRTAADINSIKYKPPSSWTACALNIRSNQGTLCNFVFVFRIIYVSCTNNQRWWLDSHTQ